MRNMKCVLALDQCIYTPNYDLTHYNISIYI